MEKTYLMIKPDGIQRNLIGEVVSRFEKKGFKLVGAKLMNVSREGAEKHYEEHAQKPFFDELVEFITSGPVFAMAWEGDDVVAIARKMIGATSPLDSLPGTIRGDFAATKRKNIIHGSDSVGSAERELRIFFSEEELLSFDLDIEAWIN